VSLASLRAFAVTRSLFTPVSLKRAIERFGFVQADPIRAPARAQDLTLRHRAVNYRAGDLERRYATLGIEEDFFINYGFVSPRVHALMHPRKKPPAWPESPRTRVHKLLAYVRTRGQVHPREVDAHFSHGLVTNYWGGSSSVTTRLMDELLYRGWLRIIRRERGIRIYALREPGGPPGDDLSPRQRVDALVDVAVSIYAPLPAPSLSYVIGRLRYAVPQWRSELKGALARARRRLAHEQIDGVDWYWPGDERLAGDTEERVRLLAPFDPIVWDRRRFELLWGWPYRFEAYTPAAKRRFGYYALPLLWGDRVIGWTNVSVANGSLTPEFGYIAGRAPRDRAYARELDAELNRLSEFLRL
jgi:hypothetical protein